MLRAIDGGNDSDFEAGASVVVDDHAYSCDVELESSRPNRNLKDLPDSKAQACSQPSASREILVKKTNSSSVIWTFFGFNPDSNGFPIENGKPKCRTCYKPICCKFGNTSNLFKHLKDRHPSLYGKAQVQQYVYIGLLNKLDLVWFVLWFAFRNREMTQLTVHSKRVSQEGQDFSTAASPAK